MIAEQDRTLLLRGGLIYRDAHDSTPADAVLILGGTIVEVGAGADLEAGADRTIDLDGAAVLPGLTDAHVHLFTLGLARLQVSFARHGARTIGDVVSLLHANKDRRPAAEWLQGLDLNEDLLSENRLPTRAELDAVFPDRPVLLRRYCGHAAVFNSAAMRALGIDERAPDPPFGHYEREADGRLNGIAFEQAAEAIFRAAPAPAPGIIAAEIRAVIDQCLGLGLTAMTEAAVGFVIGHDRETEVWDILKREDDLPVRLGFMHQLSAREAAERDLSPVHGKDWSADTLKFFADGIIGGRTAALSEPFCDRGGLGTFMRDEAAIAEDIIAAHKAGWRVAVHACGDRAITLVLDSYEKAQRDWPRTDPRHRIEHCFVPPKHALERLAALGALVVTQPSFVWRMGRSASAGLGPERTRSAYPGRSARQAGAALVFSSDAPTGVLTPWRGIQTAIERQTAQGVSLGADEALDRREALDAYLSGGARAMRHEGFRGRIEKGAAADLVVLDRNPINSDLSTLHETMSLLTIVRGRIVHDALDRANA